MTQPDPQTGLVDLAAEQDVVQRLMAGDRSAAGQLYAWYGERLYRQAILPRLPIPELAEDVLKDTFRTVLERIETYTFTDRSIFFWLRRIAINRAIDVHRAHKRRLRLQEDQHHDAIVERTTSQQPLAPDRGPEMDETRAQVEKALELMNPRYAQALRMRLIEDKDREDCADELGVKVGNFDVIFHRACKAFRKVWPP
ncbi:MAG: sigma-70 family RNA polymerase sigma factor [Alphaproteobacteria bacterium]|nr:sigma-70 family RNA polymerase sigma factor [Alphaproteobacteria bacterium]